MTMHQKMFISLCFPFLICQSSFHFIFFFFLVSKYFSTVMCTTSLCYFFFFYIYFHMEFKTDFTISFSLFPSRFTAPHELTFLIISQNYSFSAKLANELKNNILHQLQIEAFLNNNEVSREWTILQMVKKKSLLWMTRKMSLKIAIDSFKIALKDQRQQRNHIDLLPFIQVIRWFYCYCQCQSKNVII